MKNIESDRQLIAACGRRRYGKAQMADNEETIIKQLL